MIREPKFSGKFYLSERHALRKSVNSFLEPDAEKVKAIGAMVPHAGYLCSGPVAGAVYSRIDIPELVILLGPSHTGAGPEFSVMEDAVWRTPLGEVKVSDKAVELRRKSSLLENDSSAHLYEHSLEVQLPFLQVCANHDFEFVPIIISSLETGELIQLGREIAGFIKQLEQRVLVLASSDMSHYEEDKIARRKDTAALETMLNLNPEELLHRVQEQGISMCGVAPAAVMLSAVRELGIRKIELVKYNTSGDTCGGYDSVVGYAGVIVT
jgi:MEMO1 family protein